MSDPKSKSKSSWVEVDRKGNYVFPVTGHVSPPHLINSNEIIACLHHTHSQESNGFGRFSTTSRKHTDWEWEDLGVDLDATVKPWYKDDSIFYHPNISCYDAQNEMFYLMQFMQRTFNAGDYKLYQYHVPSTKLKSFKIGAYWRQVQFVGHKSFFYRDFNILGFQSGRDDVLHHYSLDIESKRMERHKILATDIKIKTRQFDILHLVTRKCVLLFAAGVVYEYSLVKSEWRQLDVVLDIPTARNFAVTSDRSERFILILGGYDTEYRFGSVDKIYVWDTQTNQFTRSTIDMPRPGDYHAICTGRGDAAKEKLTFGFIRRCVKNSIEGDGFSDDLMRMVARWLWLDDQIVHVLRYGYRAGIHYYVDINRILKCVD